MDMQAEQERLLRRLGAPPEPRKFIPHVTLARLRGASAGAVAAYLGARGYFPPLRFTAERFVLYSSRNSVGGGPYIVEAEYPLLGAASADRTAEVRRTQKRVSNCRRTHGTRIWPSAS